MKETEEHVFFYGAEDVVSNFYPSPYKLYGLTMHTSEHGFHFCKAVHFGTEEIALQILANPNPTMAKQLGRRVPNFDEHEWDGVCERYMRDNLRAKFTQHKHIYDFVTRVRSEGKRFVEASRPDAKWGIGLWDNQAMKTPEEEWPGQNLLGRVIDEVTDRLILEDPWLQSGRPPIKVSDFTDDNDYDEYD